MCIIPRQRLPLQPVLPNRCQIRPLRPTLLRSPPKGSVRASSAGSAGAVRSAVAGIGRLRRRTAPPAIPTPTPAKTLQTPAPPRRPRQAARRATLPADAPFTPEKFSELSPKACAILNLPFEDCDPAFVRFVLAVLARYRDATPEMSVTEARALFAELWELLGGPVNLATPEAAQNQPSNAAATEEPAPVAEMLTGPAAEPNAAPPALPASQAAPGDTPDDLPNGSSALPGTEAADVPHGAESAAIAEPDATPFVTALPKPRLSCRRPRRHDRRQVHDRRHSAGPVRPGVVQAPPRRRSYAARASPP